VTEHFLEDEEDGGAAHVAEVAEDVAAGGEGVRGEVQGGGDAVEDGSAAGVDGPVGDGFNRPTGEEGGVGEEGGDLGAEDVRDVAGEDEVEAVVADIPGHFGFGAGDEGGGEVVEFESGCGGFFGGHEAGGGAVGEEGVGKEGVRAGVELHVEGAEFEADDEDDCGGVGLAKLGGHAESREGSVAAHEAEGVALDGGGEAEVADEVVVGSGVGEAGAGGEDEMGDAAARRVAGFGCREEVFDELEGEGGGFAGEDGVAGGGAWGIPLAIGAGLVEVGVLIEVGEDAVASVDAAAGVEGVDEALLAAVRGPAF